MIARHRAPGDRGSTARAIRLIVSLGELRLRDGWMARGGWETLDESSFAMSWGSGRRLVVSEANPSIPAANPPHWVQGSKVD